MREARFIVFIVKPSPMPSPEGRLHRTVKKATKRMSLESNASGNLLVIGVRLIFQEEVVFK
jgi:hypothetical protein